MKWRAYHAKLGAAQAAVYRFRDSVACSTLSAKRAEGANGVVPSAQLHCHALVLRSVRTVALSPSDVPLWSRCITRDSVAHLTGGA